MKKHKKYTWIVIGVLVIVVGLLMLYNREWSIFGTQEEGQFSETPQGTPTGGTATKGLTLTNVTPRISYGDAIRKYNGKLIQFDPVCHPQPYPNLVGKNGNSFMFDNRSAKARVLTFDSQRISMKAWGWIVLAMKYAPNSGLPHKVQIDCDKGQNYGSVLLEK